MRIKRQSWQRFLLGWFVMGFAFSLAPTRSLADDAVVPGEFNNRIYRDDQGSHKYVVFLPKSYAPDRKYPVILWLHGASARGKDGRAPLVAGLAPNIAQRRDHFPFIVVFPQCEFLQSRLLGGWTDERTDADRALKILEAVEQDFRCDPQHRVLAGVSMGAFGVWAVGARTSSLWSALVPVSGGGPLILADELKAVPVWAFHAADDQVVPPSASSTLIDAVNQQGGHGYYAQLPEGGHNIGSRVFAKDEVYTWLLDPQQQPTFPTEWKRIPSAQLQLQNEIAFVPGAEVDDAVNVRIGSNILQALSYTLPDQIPRETLQGFRGPEAEMKSSGWMRFQVVVAGVQYTGEIRAAKIEALSDNQLRISLGIQPLTMTILGTNIQSRMLRADAGPMQIVIGSSAPAWLNLVVKPRVESRRLKLDLLSADFPIEPGNWYVTEPQGVAVRPLPFLRDRVTRQITDGIYAKQHEISQQVVAGVPRMLEQIEAKVQQRLDQTVTFGQWPMPVWQPRAKFWLSHIKIQPDGISISLGATLAALAPPTDTVPVKRHAGLPEQVPEDPHSIQVAISKNVITAWTELLAVSEVRRFHVQDFHAKEFHQLANADFLDRVIPGWKDRSPESQMQSVLSFEQPMEFTAVESDQPSTSDESTLRMIGRELRLTISERSPAEKQWSSVAEFPLTWSQDFQITMLKPEHRTRKLLVTSKAPPQVVATGRYLDTRWEQHGDLRPEYVATQFQQGWEATFASAMGKQTSLPERMLAGIPFLCNSIHMQRDYLLVKLAPPTTQIRNYSTGPLSYEIQLPGVSSRTPYVLPAGMMHEFNAPTPLSWHSVDNGRELHFTLPLGSISQYHADVENPLRMMREKPTQSSDLAQDPNEDQLFR